MTKPLWDTAWVNARIMPCESDLRILNDAAITTHHGKISWIGPMQALPPVTNQTIIDVENRLITPGFIDCHTHLIYAHNRAHEFALRLEGVSYADIAKSGGGIQSTVNKTRDASFEDLLQVSKRRAAECMRQGITTLEIKSGYGLDLDTELKMLRVAKALGETLPLHIKTTFLGAHTVPIEYRGRANDYIEFLCHDVLPKIVEEQLADAVDIFCEHLAFNLSDAKRLFECAKQYKLKIKCHAEQLTASGAAKLAAQYGALSVDHLEYLTEEDVKALANTKTVAVLLPAAFYFLREHQAPPIALLRQYGIPIAIATDHNPGTSPILSLLSTMNMAATLFKLTPQEIMLGVTQQAAKALGILADCGTLTVGKHANFAIWDVDSPIELFYYIREAPLFQRVYQGNLDEASVLQD